MMVKMKTPSLPPSLPNALPLRYGAALPYRGGGTGRFLGFGPQETHIFLKDWCLLGEFYNALVIVRHCLICGYTIFHSTFSLHPDSWHLLYICIEGRTRFGSTCNTYNTRLLTIQNTTANYSLVIHLDFELVKSHRKKIDEADLTTFETNNYDVNTKSDRRPENALSTDVRASEEDGMHDEKWPSETLQSIIKRSCVRCAKNSSVNGSRKRAGIDTYERKLFCSPYNAS